MTDELKYIRDWLRERTNPSAQMVGINTPTGRRLVQLYVAHLNPGEVSAPFVVTSTSRRQPCNDLDEVNAALVTFTNAEFDGDIFVFKYIRRV